MSADLNYKIISIRFSTNYVTKSRATLTNCLVLFWKFWLVSCRSVTEHRVRNSNNISTGIYIHIYIHIYTYTYTYIYIYIYIYTQVSSLESYTSRVLNTVVELIRLEDKIELLHMNFISLRVWQDSSCHTKQICSEIKFI
jgi:hypothetical protein